MMPRMSGWGLALVVTSASGIAHAQAPAPSTSPPVSVAAIPALPPEPPIDHVAGVPESELLDRWIRESPEVQEWRTEIGGARFDVVTASLFPNPVVAVSTLTTHTGQAPDSEVNFQAQVQQELPVLGQISARVDEATMHLRASELHVMVQIWDRYGDLRSAMVERAYADVRAQMFERNLAELDRIINIVTTRASSGATPAYDLVRVQLTATTIRANLREALLERRTAESQLVSLLAIPGLDTAPVQREGLIAMTYPTTDAELLELALARRPDLELSRRSSAAARASADRQRAEVVPTPSIWVGSYVGIGPYAFSLLGGVSIPVPLFDQNQGDIGAALSEAAGYDDEADALDDRIRVEVFQAARRIREAQEALDRFRAVGLTLSDQVIQLAELSYQGGRFMIADLFDAYTALWAARAEEIELEHQLHLAEVELARAAALFEVPGAATTAPSASRTGGAR